MIAIDIRQRLHQELRAIELASPVRLEGNPMQVAVAKLLLKEHGIVAHQHGIPVRLMSMEAYCSAFLKSFLEEIPPPEGVLFLTTIPEEELIRFAQEHGIPVVREEHDDARRMLDAIAASQPQTYFSLRKSSERLRAAAQLLREQGQK